MREEEKECNLNYRMAITQICLIIDIEGFYVANKFHPREIGFSSLSNYENNAYRFNLNHIIPTMSEKDWKTAMYTKHNIHGLSIRLRPDEKDAFSEDSLKGLIYCLYKEHKTFQKKYIAYKGGNIEKTLLTEMNIPSVNLEEYGCPKFEQLPPSNVNQCGFHKKMKKVHCAKQECYTFAVWVRNNV